MNEAVTNIIDTHTQEGCYGPFRKLLEQYKTYIVTGEDYFEGD